MRSSCPMLLPRAERQPRRRRGARPAAAPGRRSAAAALRHRAGHRATPMRSPISTSCAAAQDLRQGRRLRASRDAGQATARRARPGALLLDGGDTWQGSATALWTKGQDMVDAAQAAGRGRHDRALGVHARRRPREGGRRQRLQGQDRLRRAERRDRRLRRPGLPALRDHAEVNGVPVAIIGQAFPYTPIANPRYFVAGLDASASRTSACRRSSTRRAARARRRSCCCRTTAWTSTSSSPRACSGIDAILGGHTHDGVPAPVVVEQRRRARRWSPTPVSNGKFLGVLDFDVQGGKVADLPLPAAAGVLQPAARGPGDGGADREGPRAVRGQAGREARGHRGPAVPPRQLQRHLRPADPRRADGRQGRADRVFARLPLGHDAAARRRRSPSST